MCSPVEVSADALQGSASFTRLKGNAHYVGVVGLGKRKAAAAVPEWGISCYQVLHECMHCQHVLCGRYHHPCLANFQGILQHPEPVLRIAWEYKSWLAVPRLACVKFML